MSAKSSTAKIVHESETQRQHVRVQIPARAELNGAIYNIRDLSVSGASIENVETPFMDGAQINLVLAVPFESFSLHVSLRAVVTHYDGTARLLGCQFTDLSREQLSILNTVIQSYMSGVIVKEGDLLNVVARDNFVKIRREIREDESRDIKSLIKRAMPFAFMAVAAMLGSFFITGNIYEKLAVLKSYQASVKSESVILRAGAAGIFTSGLPDGTDKVAKGQVLGTIEGTALISTAGTTPAAAADAAAAAVVPAGNATTTVTTTIVSPCECYFDRQYVQNGLFRDIGEPVFKLIPVDVKPTIKAMVSAEDVVRLNLRDKAIVHITGEQETVTGIVMDIETADDNASNSTVNIRPERPLSYKLVDRPAYVEFHIN